MGARQGRRRREGGQHRDGRSQTRRQVLIKDAIADITLQQVLTRPDEFDVIATLNLNGDYLSDALAAQVGGIGIAPGGNINYLTGHAVFEATHGTAPKYANLDKVNPGSVILSGEMMFRYMGWTEAADAIIQAHGQGHRPEDRDLRLRPPDGRRPRSLDVSLRRRPHPQHVTNSSGLECDPARLGPQVQAIAQNGLAFTTDPFDKERYIQLTELVASILATELDIPVAQAKGFWAGDTGYVTPKVDVRGGIFEDGSVLLVRERSDGKWTLPGGWVDINDSPSGAVVREILEESGYHARAVKLAALIDKLRHPHPPGIHHIYKLFFLCERIGGAAATSSETDAVQFFPVRALPELSTGRVLASQIERLHQHQLHPELPTYFD